MMPTGKSLKYNNVKKLHQRFRFNRSSVRPGPLCCYCWSQSCPMMSGQQDNMTGTAQIIGQKLNTTILEIHLTQTLGKKKAFHYLSFY